jgi:quercetin dioxygenase-like cupin family protein
MQVCSTSYIEKLWQIREEIINMIDRKEVLSNGRINIRLDEGKIVGKQIFLEDDVLIDVWDVAEDTEHPLHQHNGVEVIFMISGELLLKRYNGMENVVTLRTSDSISLKAHEEHSTFFPRKSRVITITYPSEKGYVSNGN